MQMTQQDVDFYLWSLPRTVAKELGIKDVDFLSSADLDEEMFKVNTEAYVKLEEFIAIYKKWYQFQVDKTEDMEKGRLSPKDFETSMALITERDGARQILIETVRQ
jgi:hypothetical protein